MSEEFSRLLDSLDHVIAAGIHVVVTAHAKMRKFEQPDEMGAYDRWETKLKKQAYRLGQKIISDIAEAFFPPPGDRLRCFHS